MKYLIVSDIHGSLPALEKVLTFYEKEGYGMMLILGDIINYGPRNGLPEGLDPQGIVSRLNAIKDRIVAVRGNCDSEVDQMLLEFPIMAPYSYLIDSGRRIFLTHGHVHTPDNINPASADVFIGGHTHLMGIERRSDGLIVCNSGSVTFPKGGNPPSFMTLDDGIIRLRTLDGEVIKEMTINYCL